MANFNIVPFKKALKENALFSLPLMAGQIGQMLFGIGDTIVIGRYSAVAVGAVGVANGLFLPLIITGIGLLGAVGPIIAIEKNSTKGKDTNLGSVLVVCTIISIALIIAGSFLNYSVPLFSFNEEIIPGVQTYLGIVLYSIPGSLFYQGIKEFLQAHHDTKIPNFMVFFFNLLNVFLNMLLIFGWKFIPEMGIQGAAITTVICRSLMGVTLFLYAMKVHKKIDLSFNKELHNEIFKLGMPLSGGTLLEGSIFSIATILIGRMDVLSSASHNIVLNLASTTFMVPLAISSAASIKVAEAWSQGDKELVKYNCLSTNFLSTIFMIFTAMCYWLFPESILRIMTDDYLLIERCTSMLFILAFFQIPDGIQVTMWGTLRAFKVAKLPFILTIIGHYLIGLPFGLYFAYTKNMGANGLWIGLSIGLSMMAIGLGANAYYHYKRLPSFTATTPI